LLGDADLTRAERLDVLLRLAHGPRGVTHALPRSARRVPQRRVGPERAAHDTEERELAEVRVGERLEDERRHGGLGLRRARARLLRLELGPRDLAAVRRRRERL